MNKNRLIGLCRRHGAAPINIVDIDVNDRRKGCHHKGDNDYMDHINPDSLRIVEGAWIEPSLAEALPEQGFQFEREGYFVADRRDHSADAPVFNQVIGLRDVWAGKAGGEG